MSETVEDINKSVFFEIVRNVDKEMSKKMKANAEKYKGSREVVTYYELRKAYRECLKKKRKTVSAVKFQQYEDIFLHRLHYALNNFDYDIGKSIAFIVTSPVPREIFAADFVDRIVHHLLIRRMMPLFESEFIDNTYSCRKGKGTLCGIEQCEKMMRECSENYTKEAWVLKCDIKSFFMSIPKPLLYLKLLRLIKSGFADKPKRYVQFVAWATYKVVFNDPKNNCIPKGEADDWNILPSSKTLFSCNCLQGLPIGNLTSQLYANYFLNDFDHYVIETLGFKYYGRYVDDFFIISTDKEKLIEAKRLIKDELAKIGVMLHPNKVYLQKVEKGVKFIGGVIKPNRKYVANRTKGNCYKMLKDSQVLLKVINDKRSDDNMVKECVGKFCQQMNSYLGLMKHYDTRNLRKKILRGKLFAPWREYVYTTGLDKVTPFREYAQHPKRKQPKCPYPSETKRKEYIAMMDKLEHNGEYE